MLAPPRVNAESSDVRMMNYGMIVLARCDETARHPQQRRAGDFRS